MTVVPAMTPDHAAVRDPSGRWIAGRSGNPAGRRPIERDIAEAARVYSRAAIEVLVEALSAPDAPWPARIRAAEILLERGYGRAPLVVLAGAVDPNQLSDAALAAIVFAAADDMPPLEVSDEE